MPWVVDAGKGYYSNPIVESACSYSQHDIDKLNSVRKRLAQQRDCMKGHQRHHRVIKDIARELHKEYQGMCFVLSQIMATPSGDCIIQPNPDLAPYIDGAWRKACFGYYPSYNVAN